MKVTNYTSINKDQLVAYFSLYIEQWGMYLNDCKLIRTKTGGMFVGFPNKKYEKDGETKYSPYFCFDKEVNERFQKAARAAIDEYVKQNAEKPAEKPNDATPTLDDDECPF